MPEGPELFLSGQFINRICAGRIFSGKVVKSEVSWKNPEVDWNCPAYTVHAQSRGKEMKLTLTKIMNDIKTEKKNLKKSEFGESLDILFRFGMSGRFTYTRTDDMHKHAHLNFFTRDDDMVLSFVDTRRFGRWEINSPWSEHRGPCVIQEPEEFRANILDNLKDSSFNRPICETLLNQKFFNGIGNYLRAEILYRLEIPPFMCARDVLAPLVETRNVKREKEDILDLSHSVPLEVTQLGSSGYDPEASTKDYTAFSAWLKCYSVDGMKNMADHNNRTIWFSGQPGPMVPSCQKTKKPVKRNRKEKNEDEKPNPKKMKSEESSENSEGCGSEKAGIKKSRRKREIKTQIKDHIKVKSRKVKIKKEIKIEEDIKSDQGHRRRSSRVMARTKQKAKK